MCDLIETSLDVFVVALLLPSAHARSRFQCACSMPQHYAHVVIACNDTSDDFP